MELSVLARLGCGSIVLADALERSGWNLLRLGSLLGISSEEMRGVSPGLEMINPGLTVQVSELRELIEAAAQQDRRTQMA